MIIGEIVETLIRLRDSINLDSHTGNAVCAACNILDRLPRLEDEYNVEQMLSELNKENKK